MKKPELVDDWRQCLRWYSTQSHLLLVNVGIIWAMIPEDMRASVPPSYLGAAAVVLGVAGVAGRLVKQ